MRTRFDLIELCAGMGHVTSAAVIGSPVIGSRIGSKRGYVAAILKIMGMRPDAGMAALVVESDPRVCDVLRVQYDAKYRTSALAWFRRISDVPARRAHAESVAEVGPGPALAEILSRRGGVGGFKGAHKLRPSVDGFIPSRSSTIAMLQEAAPTRDVVVMCARVEFVDPSAFEPTTVYVDPPYQGRTGYAMDEVGFDVAKLAERWRSAGHHFYASESTPIRGADATYDITKLRVGQSRRSMTKSVEEWLSRWEPRP